MSRSEDSSRRRSMARWATALVSIAGIIAAWYLTDMHIQAEVGDTVGGALCDAHRSFDCESAIDSDFSELFGIPISLLGLAFYASILAMATFETPKIRKSSNAFRPAAIATFTFGIGVLYSIFLAVVSVVEVGSICPFCAGLYTTNIVGFISASVWAGMWPQDVLKAQLRNTGAFYNGWTGLFAMAYGVVLIVSMIWMEAEIDDRVAEEERATEEVAETMEDVEPEDYRSAQAPAKGPESAPVHIVEFSSFTCPHCAGLAGVMDQVAEDYGDDLRVEFRHFPLDGNARAAARGAHCADEQGRFWEMREVLFANHQNLSADRLPEFAAQIGVDVDEFAECVDDSATRARVDADVTTGRELGIRGTPTFFVNGERFTGMLPYEELARVVDREL